MKRTFTIILFSAGFVLTGLCVNAQDSTKPGVIKQINSNSEKSDKLQGKKIQQQSLSKNRFEKLDAISANPANKNYSKKVRKRP